MFKKASNQLKKMGVKIKRLRGLNEKTKDQCEFWHESGVQLERIYEKTVSTCVEFLNGQKGTYTFSLIPRTIVNMLQYQRLKRLNVLSEEVHCVKSNTL